MSLKNIKKNNQNYEMCLSIVQQNGKEIKFVSNRLIDDKLCKVAIKSDWQSLQYIPERFKNKELYDFAFTVNIKSIKHIDRDYQTKEMVEKIAEENPMLLEYVDFSLITNKICKIAINNNIESIIYFPFSELKKRHLNSLKIKQIKILIDKYPYLLKFLKAKKENVKLCLNYMEGDYKISKEFSDEIKEDLRILNYQKKLGILKISSKYYCEENNEFVADIEITYKTICKKIYNTNYKTLNFDEFYNFLECDLNGCNLYNFNFDGIDLHNYNIDGALIKGEILNSQNLYDGRYFDKIKIATDYIDKITENYNIVPYENNNELLDLSFLKNEILEENVFVYISDIHLLHKIENNFKDIATKEEIGEYIKKLGKELGESTLTNDNKVNILIAGDTSSYFPISEIFYESLVKYCNSSTNIIVVSGNHELLYPYLPLEENLQYQRDFFKKNGIHFLHNEIMFIHENKNIILDYEQIKSYTNEEIESVARESSIIIMGGIGFNCYDDEFNATIVPYGKSFDELDLSSRIELEKNEAKKFNNLYTRIRDILAHRKVIVLSHMPKNSWNNEEYVSSWIYVNGHNHNNNSSIDTDYKVYADNQIGYKSQKIQFKYFLLDTSYDYFQFNPNGIYRISVDEYKKFHLYKQIQLTYNREDNDIYMIKKNDVYMFVNYCKIRKDQKEKKYYLLKGGKLNSLDIKNISDLDKIYSNLEDYYNKFVCLMRPYLTLQEQLSKLIKMIGGSGKIHGCIIDLDKPEIFMHKSYSFSHIYLNPFDLKITAYTAYNILCRKVYKNVQELLEDNYKESDLYKNFLTVIQSKNPLVSYYFEKQDNNKKIYTYDDGDYLYKISRRIRNLQIMIDKKVIRYWSDSFFVDNEVTLPVLLINAKEIDDIFE